MSDAIPAPAADPLIVPIDDPLDPRIERFRNIRDRDLVQSDGFIAEGTVVVKALLASTAFRPRALLVLENRLTGLMDRLGRLPVDVPIYVAQRSVLDAIAGFAMHRGVLALGAPVLEPGDLAELLEAARLDSRPVVVGIGLSNHDNVGSIFRNAAAFGAGAVLLDDTSCHPLYRKALRVSVGTVLSVPWEKAGAGLQLARAAIDAGFEPIALSPSGTTDLSEFRPAKPAALFLGTEGAGLPAAVMAGMQTLRIEQLPEVDSLNVATSAAIVLHRLFAARP